MREFNKEGRKAGKELSADLLPAFLLSLFNHPEPVARDAKWDRICSALNPNDGRLLSCYAANHSVLPGVTLEARAPDHHGHPTGHLVKLGGNTVHEWEYENDPFGRIAGIASGDVTVAIEPQPGTRHIRERVTRVSNQIVHRSTRGIDMLGRATGMVSRAPDPDNGGTLRILASAGHQHDPRGRRQNTRREDGTKWEYGYNDRSEVTSAVKTTANSQLVPGQYFVYQFDIMGNRITSTSGTAPNAAVTGYAPNALNQYEQITTPGDLHILARSEDAVSFTIDGAPATITSTGNLHGAHATVSNSPNGAYPEIEIDDGTILHTGHRWIAPATVEPQYDYDGNLTQDGRWIYHWDAENRLVKLETLASAIAAGVPALTIEYTYDWRSRKIRETVTDDTTTVTHDQRTLYDHWNPVANFTIQNSTFTIQNSLLWGPDLSGTHQGAGGVGGLILITDHSALGTDGYFPSYDTNGNIIAWSDATGKLIRRLDYDPFGNTVVKETLSGDESALDAVLRHSFSTKPADNHSGLLYFGYRWLDPVTGRWPSRDPIEERGGTNLHAFVLNNVVNHVDVLGRLAFPPSGSGGPGYWEPPPTLKQVVDARAYARHKLSEASLLAFNVYEGTSSGMWISINNIFIPGLFDVWRVYYGSGPMYDPVLGLSISLSEDTHNVLHEVVHSINNPHWFNMMDERKDEGMAHAVDYQYVALEGLNTLQQIMNSGDDCARLIRLSNRWIFAWDPVAIGNIGKTDSGIFTLSDKDFNNAFASFNVKLSCKRVAETLNRVTEGTDRCCIRFLCESGKSGWSTDGSAYNVRYGKPIFQTLR
jgi:RHS repeat-associated protein